MPDAQASQMWMQDLKSLNFEPLRAVAAELANMGGYAEHYAHTDPEGALIKLRPLPSGWSCVSTCNCGCSGRLARGFWTCY
jgi:hypothetical protein